MLDILDSIPEGILVSTLSRSRESVLRSNHRHDFHELYFMAQGSARHFIGNELVHTETGDFAMIQKDALHRTTYTPGVFTQRTMVCFTDEFLGDGFQDITETLARRKRLRLPQPVLSEAVELVNRLQREYTQKDSCCLEMCRCLLRALLILFYRSKPEKQTVSMTPSERLIQDAAAYISRHWGEELSLARLSETYAMSQAHFSRLFKSVTGFGVSEYITAVRLLQAERLLTEGFSVTETAARCGYNDSNYFSTVFKRKKGLSPKKFAALRGNDGSKQLR